MQVRVHAGKDPRSDAFARFHQAACDLPFEDGGNEGGMTAPEMLLSAMGCCAAQGGQEFLRGRRIFSRTLEITLRGEECGTPPGLSAIELTVHAPGLSPFLRAGVLKAMENSILALLFKDPPRLSVTAK